MSAMTQSSCETHTQLDDPAAVAAPSITAARCAVAGGMLCVFIFVLLHVAMAGVVDPAQQPISDTALDQPGTVLFGFGVLTMAVACTALALGGIGLSDEMPVRRTLSAVAVLLVVVAIFPTDRGPVPTSVVGEIHRWSASIVFLALTLAAWQIWQRTDAEPRRRWLAALTVAGVVSLAINSVNLMFPEFANGWQWRGVPQRAMLITHLTVILTLAIGATQFKSEPEPAVDSAAAPAS